MSTSCLPPKLSVITWFNVNRHLSSSDPSPLDYKDGLKHVLVSISNNGVDYSSGIFGGTGSIYYFDKPNLISLYPMSVPFCGDTTVVISGYSFFPSELMHVALVLQLSPGSFYRIHRFLA